MMMGPGGEVGDGALDIHTLTLNIHHCGFILSFRTYIQSHFTCKVCADLSFSTHAAARLLLVYGEVCLKLRTLLSDQ